MPRIHEVKCLPEYFGPLERGLKTFEFRKNDRGYEVGDYLAVNEYDGEHYTGRCAVLEITYILDPNEVQTCVPGYVIMSVVPTKLVDDRLTIHLGGCENGKRIY